VGHVSTHNLLPQIGHLRWSRPQSILSSNFELNIVLNFSCSFSPLLSFPSLLQEKTSAHLTKSMPRLFPLSRCFRCHRVPFASSLLRARALYGPSLLFPPLGHRSPPLSAFYFPHFLWFSNSAMNAFSGFGSGKAVYPSPSSVPFTFDLFRDQVPFPATPGRPPHILLLYHAPAPSYLKGCRIFPYLYFYSGIIVWRSKPCFCLHIVPNRANAVRF